MSDIQRWDFWIGLEEVQPDDNGPYVLYADHVAAVAEAEQRAQRRPASYFQGRDDERARIRAGVEALVRFDHNGYALVVYPDGDFLDRAEVLAVVDGEDTA